jgi:hypothetical protein
MATHVIKYFIFLLILLFWIGCEDIPNAQFKQEVSVACVISAHYENQQMYIYYTSESTQNIDNREKLFVKNAHVEIASDNQIVPFKYGIYEVPHYLPEFPPSIFSIYKDYDQKLRVENNKTYTLQVETDAGTVTGSTTVPAPFNILYPEKNSTINGEGGIFAKWQKSEGSAMYLIEHVSPPDTFISRMTGEQVIRSNVASNWTANTSVELESFYRLPKKGKHTLRVIACDINFKRHLLDGVHISGIEGGYGYFGSAVVDTTDFYIE